MAQDTEIEVYLIRALSGEEVARVKSRQSDTVGQLQQSAAEQVGMSTTAIVLLLGAQTLQAKETLASAGIQDGAIVYVMCRRGGLVISSAHDRFAKVWDVDSGQCILTIKEHHRVNSSAVSPDGSLVATASDDGVAKIWNAKSAECVLTLAGHASAVMSASFSLDGASLVTGSRDTTAMVWNVSSGQRTLVLAGHSKPLRPAAFSEDGQLIITGSEDCSAKVWRSQDGSNPLTLTGHRMAVFVATFSHSGGCILTGSFDGTVMIWNTESGECLRTLVPHKAESVCSVAFSPDDQSIMTCSPFDREVIVWSTDDMKATAVLLHGSMPSSAAWLPDGRTIVTGTCIGNVHVWSSETGQCSNTIRGHKGLVTSISFAGM